MESKAADKQASVGAETTDSVKSLHTDQATNTTGLPSPPSSVKATADRSLSGEVAGSGESSLSAHGEANAADAIDDEPSSRQASNGPGQEGTDPPDKHLPHREERSAAMREGLDLEVDDHDLLKAMLNQIRRDTLYPHLGEEKAPLQERIKKGAKLVVQQMEYARLMEDRMKDMESRLRLIENEKLQSGLPAPPPRKSTQPADLIMGIKRMTHQEYLPIDPEKGIPVDPLAMQHKRRHEFPGQLPYHLIDVVVGGMGQPERLGKDQISRPVGGPHDAAAPVTTILNQDLTGNDQSFVQPERIRINSTLLLRALQKITIATFSLTKIEKVEKDFVLEDQVILRPFKVLVSFEQEIRDEIDRLQKIHNSEGSEGRPGVSEMAGYEGNNSPTSPSYDLNILPDTPKDAGHEHLDDSRDDKSRNAIKNASVRGMNEDLESRRCLEELLVLRDLLDKDLKGIFDLRRQMKDGSVQSVAFQDLWHLFPLGSEIVSNGLGGQNQTYRVLNVTGGRNFLCNRFEAGMDSLDPPSDGRIPLDLPSNGRERPKFEILSYRYDFDGKELGARQELHTIKLYDGNKAITSLPCFPVVYSKSFHGLKPRDFFISRGKRFIELTRKTEVVHKRYNGLTLAMDALREEIDSEVIVDVSMALLKNNVTIAFGLTQELEPDLRETTEFLDPRCRLVGCCQNTPIHRDYEIDQSRYKKMLEEESFMRAFIESDSELTEEDYLVLPCWVYGYVLRSRKWVKLEVSLIEDIKDSGSGFDSLVLPDGHKETLLALVKTHSQGKTLEIGVKAENRHMDLVRGKGKGLIILLHGEPGVGKSSTAESVAEFTHRPLFQVTCGDIGESADEVERRLEDHFQLAHRWGCVLLLDEADVFLEARSKTDLKRNAIVSVFLRVLEYYSGILFLTTNRVGAFDQAFRSRIHMSLFYPRIEEDATIKIWEMNIDRAREIWGDKLSIDEADRKGILKFALKHYRELAESETTWNGRQIRNAFQTAIALAEWAAYKSQLKFKSPVPLKPRLESEHFEQVAKASKHFDAYLKETQVGSMADLASNNRERRDDFRG